MSNYGTCGYSTGSIKYLGTGGVRLDRGAVCDFVVAKQLQTCHVKGYVDQKVFTVIIFEIHVSNQILF